MKASSITGLMRRSTFLQLIAIGLVALVLFALLSALAPGLGDHRIGIALGLAVAVVATAMPPLSRSPSGDDESTR